jgi:hypothetical protein
LVNYDYQMMENPVKVHFHLNPQGCIQLSLECPACAKYQDLPIVDLQTGLGLICDCGEDIPLHTETLTPVIKEMEMLEHLIERTVTLPV